MAKPVEWLAQMAHHIAERRIFAADDRDIGTTQPLKPDDLMYLRGHHSLLGMLLPASWAAVRGKPANEVKPFPFPYVPTKRKERGL